MWRQGTSCSLPPSHAGAPAAPVLREVILHLYADDGVHAGEGMVTPIRARADVEVISGPKFLIAYGRSARQMKRRESLRPLGKATRIFSGVTQWIEGARDFSAYFPRLCLFCSCKSSEAFIGFSDSNV